MPERLHAAPPSRARLLGAFAAVYLVWGSTYLAIRYAIETLPPFLMAGARFVLAGSALYAWARLRGAKAPDRGHWATTTVAGGLLLLGGNGAVVWAEQRVASGLAALLVATVPVWIVLLDTMMRGAARPGRRVGAGLVLGFVGLALLGSPSEMMGGQQVDPWGVAVLVGGSISWAVGSIYSRMARMPESLLATAMEMLTGGALLLSAGVVSGEVGRFAPHAVSPASLLAFLYLILFGSLVGFNAYKFLLGHTTPARATTYAYVNPVVALFLGWLIAGEPVTLRTLFSAAVIIIGVALIITDQRDPAAELRP
jgi:drug/metabolite transporter (DMT)-like permease